METNPLIQEQFNSLPIDVKEAISRIPWKDRVRSIAKREGLNDAMATSLETETMLILYGVLPQDSYTNNLITEVGVDAGQAERILKLVEDEIIADIEKQLEMIDALMPKDEVAAAPQVKQPETTPAPEIPVPTSNNPLVPEIAPNILPKTISELTSQSLPVPTEIKSDTPKSIVEEKLSQVTVSTKSTPYQGIDPYREPVE